jgi:hypothetical protein
VQETMVSPVAADLLRELDQDLERSFGAGSSAWQPDLGRLKGLRSPSPFVPCTGRPTHRSQSRAGHGRQHCGIPD